MLHLKEMEVRVERLETLRALYTYAFSETPEENALKEIMAMAKQVVYQKRSLKPACSVETYIQLINLNRMATNSI